LNKKSFGEMRVFKAEVLLEIAREFDEHRAERREMSLGFHEFEWYGHTTDDGWGALRFVYSLYRGQNRRYRPMLPSIARELLSSSGQLWERSSRDQALVVLRVAQAWWFARELKYHPVSKHAIEQNLRLDKMGLAQHYGIPTAYLDLTDDFNVGAFFATCYQTVEGWRPVDSGTGVVYCVDLAGGLKNPFSKYKPLGPQPLPRPTEQGAWVTELPLSDSFDGWPRVDALEFKHEPSVGTYFLEKFDGGEALFPFDPLADVANEIMQCREIPRELVDAAIESFIKDQDGIRPQHEKEIRRDVYRVATMTDYRRILTDIQVSSLIADFEWRKKMLPDVKVSWRAVRDEPTLRLEGEDGQ
jgi:hypothetical protein